MANGTRNCSHFKLRTWDEGDRKGRVKGEEEGKEKGREGGREWREGGGGKEGGGREGRKEERKKGGVMVSSKFEKNHPKVCWQDKYLNSPLWLE